ncbi:MAG: hypothetical protein OEL89_02680 [Candidatus Peregrinibacteria bacterium]|nr:hypothetical protein [Candidatus Peregrinibacteria bacterium]
MKKIIISFVILAFVSAGVGLLVFADDSEIEDCIQELVSSKGEEDTSFWDKIMKYFGDDRKQTYPTYRAFCETKRDFPDFNTDWQKNYNYLIEQKYEFEDFDFVPNTEKSDDDFKTYGVQKLSDIHYEKYEDSLKKSIKKIQATNDELEKILKSKDYVCEHQKKSSKCSE